MADPPGDKNKELSAFRDKDGSIKQRLQGGTVLSPDDAFNHLISLKASGRKPWWKDFNIVMTHSDALGCKVAALQCALCDQVLSPSNPSQSASTHFTEFACKALKGAKRAASAAGDDEDGDVVEIAPGVPGQNVMVVMVVMVATSYNAIICNCKVC